MKSAASTASMAFVSNYVQHLIYLLLLLSRITTADAADINNWRSRSIYQLITDRFAHTDNSTTAQCTLSENQYCGGTWQGIINQLDYIQGMGFTAVSHQCATKKQCFIIVDLEPT